MEENELKERFILLEKKVLKLDQFLLRMAEWTNFDLKLVNSSSPISREDDDDDPHPPYDFPQGKPEVFKETTRRSPRTCAKKSTGGVPKRQRHASNYASREEPQFVIKEEILEDNEDLDFLPSSEDDNSSDSSYSDADFSRPLDDEDDDDSSFQIEGYQNQDTIIEEENKSPFKILSVSSIAASSEQNPFVSLPKLEKKTVQKYSKSKSKRPRQKRTPKNDKNKSEKSKREPPHPCSLCDQIFTRKRLLQVHLKSEHKIMKGPKIPKKPKVLQCPYCPRKHTHKEHHTNHLRTHTGERPHLCELCGFSSARIQGLNLHRQRIHFRDQMILKFSCSFCDNKYLSKQEVLKHENKIHNNGVNDFARDCDICKHKFADITKLSRHMKEVHEEKRKFDCHLCSQSFKRGDHLKRHIQRHDKGLRRKRGPQKILKKYLVPPQDKESLQEEESILSQETERIKDFQTAAGAAASQATQEIIIGGNEFIPSFNTNFSINLLN